MNILLTKEEYQEIQLNQFNYKMITLNTWNFYEKGGKTYTSFQ